MTGTPVRVVRCAHDRRVLDVLADELGVPADEVVLVREHGKPRVVEPETELRFSVSRTPGLVVVALARGVEVGVDVESTARDVTRWALWEQLLSAEEIARLPDERSARNRALLHAWVAREAILKAAGADSTSTRRSSRSKPTGRSQLCRSRSAIHGTWSLEWLRLDETPSQRSRAYRRPSRLRSRAGTRPSPMTARAGEARSTCTAWSPCRRGSG